MGPTGVGKTKFSLLIAREFKGDIINSDAFSLYKNADHMTAKPSLDERKTIPHHMVDILQLDEVEYNLSNFQSDAIKVISELKKANKLPIVVGGSNFYVNSLLFEEVNEFTDNSDKDCKGNDDGNKESFSRYKLMVKVAIMTLEYKYKEVYKDLSLIFDKYLNKKDIKDKEDNKEKDNNDEKVKDNNEYKVNIDEFRKDIKNYFYNYKEIFYNVLECVDTESFKFLHKNDIKRIENALIFYFSNGYKKSDFITKSKKKLRYKENTIVLVLLPKNINDLFKRIESRIDEMVENGISEIFYILSTFEGKFTQTKGILQAIGYK